MINYINFILMDGKSFLFKRDDLFTKLPKDIAQIMRDIKHVHTRTNGGGEMIINMSKVAIVELFQAKEDYNAPSKSEPEAD